MRVLINREEFYIPYELMYATLETPYSVEATSEQIDKFRAARKAFDEAKENLIDVVREIDSKA